MNFEINLVTAGLAVANMLMWICLLLSWIHSYRWKSSMQGRLTAMRQQLVAVEYGSFGVGKSLLKLEVKTRSGADRYSDDHNFVSYKEAAVLLKEGADAAYLVSKLGMSRSEADLVVLLHPHLVSSDGNAIAELEAHG